MRTGDVGLVGIRPGHGAPSAPCSPAGRIEGLLVAQQSEGDPVGPLNKDGGRRRSSEGARWSVLVSDDGERRCVYAPSLRCAARNYQQLWKGSVGVDNLIPSRA